ncbi:hypothetical protein [Thalassotalea sp. ND16A]|uniref:hypothetical protein n=1 Tax=Thalassotalea sp. ND16A TaxID=1535422 RepID=UPI00051A5D40|nr:hypothetical protein [Thalassotalea sp. ND16A]KGK00624.1 hypothetical protein ND16A_3384 [Thalassotalea sp. ND16A]
MSKKFISLLLLSQLALASLVQANPSNLNPKLQVFANFLGTWEANFKMMDGNPSVVDVTTWERALNGKAIRTLHSINDGMYGGESLIFWDKAQQKIVFYYFTTADFFTRGHIEIIDDYKFVAYEDVSGSDDGITQVKSTSTLQGKNIVVSTAYLKNSKWTEPEVRTYKPSTKQVKFK